MAFQLFENLGGPNDVLEKMRDFCISAGWTILENLTDDYPITEESVNIPSFTSEAVPGSANTSTAQVVSRGTYTGSIQSQWEISITQANPTPGVWTGAKFKWRRNSGAWSPEIEFINWEIILADGVGVQLAFDSEFDVYVVGDTWSFVSKPAIVSGPDAPDGKRLSIKKGDVYACFRSANGKPIFQTQLNTTAANAHGIGLVCSTNYSSTPISGLWFDQPNATKLKSTQEVIGVGIPVKPAGNYRLYCNAISDPSDLLLFSLELEPGYYQHLAVANTSKVGAWTGGTVYSGSRNSVRMFPGSWDVSILESESNHLFGMSKYSSTFARVDIDAAPLRMPGVLWASGGPDTADAQACYTGKMLALGVMNIDCLTASWLPKVPHYGYLQSQTGDDSGRNTNTLNCISVNLPMALYVMRDPDSLRNFSQVGYVPGVYAISLYNIAPGQLYEISYPQSGNMHQVFPHVHRKGVFGYDGISVKQ